MPGPKFVVSARREEASMRAYRQTFRRHWILYLLPALLAAIAAGVLSHKAPTYASTGSLWVDNQVSSSSSLNVNPGSTQATTPAGAEQSVLSELLTTAKFDRAVATGAGLSPAFVGEVASGVTSTTPGPQVLQLSYIGPSPTMAHAVVQSVITQLQTFSHRWARDFADAAVAYYKTQVATAAHALTKARQDRSETPNIGNSALNSATAALNSNNSALSQAQVQASSNNGFATVEVLDQPSINPTPLKGLKQVVETAFAAAAAMLLLSAIVIVIRTPGGEDKWDEEMSGSRWSTGTSSLTVADGHGFPRAQAAPNMPGTSLTDHAPSHAIRRPGVLTRKAVMHQASEHEHKPPAAAEGGRA
jgi:hypothetical protein